MTDSGERKAEMALGSSSRGVWISPVPKKPEDKIVDYVKYFDRVAKANGWTDQEAAQIFPGMLEVGSTVVDNLEERVLKSFELIKSAVVPPSKTYWEAVVQKFFWSLVMRSDESVMEFVARCRDVVMECYPKFAKGNRDMLVRDRFVHGLRSELKVVVLNGRNGKLDEAVQTALMAENVRGTLVEGKMVCEGSSRGEQDMEEERKCYFCRAKGHLAWACPAKTEGGREKTSSSNWIGGVANGANE